MEVDAANGGAMQRNVTVDPALLELCQPLLDQCNAAFTAWYEQLHGAGSITDLVRLQSFITRYRPFPNENSLLRHIDGAHVDGSVILALPTDSPFTGGGVTVWEGKPEVTYKYPMAAGDMCMLDNYVWHQGNPITAGERWSLVIFYAVSNKTAQTSNTQRLLQTMKRAAMDKQKEEEQGGGEGATSAGGSE